MERALARAAAAAFYEFGLRVETHYVTAAAAGESGHVPKIVRYAVNYLKCLASDDYRGTMDAALRAGAGDDDGGDSEALAERRRTCWRRCTGTSRRRAARSRRGGVARHGHELLLVHLHARQGIGASQPRRRRHDAAAVQGVGGGGGVGVPGRGVGPARPPRQRQQLRRGQGVAVAGGGRRRRRRSPTRWRAGAAARRGYKIPDGDLREQIKAAAAKAVRGAYAGFLRANDSAVASGGGRREFLPVDAIEGMVRRVFDEMGDGGGVAGSAGRTRSRRQSGNLEGFEG